MIWSTIKHLVGSYFLVGVPVFVEMGVKARWGKHEGPFDYAGVKQ